MSVTIRFNGIETNNLCDLMGAIDEFHIKQYIKCVPLLYHVSLWQASSFGNQSTNSLFFYKAKMCVKVM